MCRETGACIKNPVFILFLQREPKQRLTEQSIIGKLDHQDPTK